MRAFFLLLSLGMMFLHAKSINIAVAANVSYAIEELKSAFNKQNPDIKVRVSLGSSGKLTAQIKHGAPYTLFMSANMKYPQSLFKEGLTQTKPLVYAQGSLALLSVKAKDFSSGLALLEQKKVRVIAVANPKTAPYGKAAFEALTKARHLTAIKKKLVYAESVAQTLSYTLRAADVGIVAKSSLFSPKLKRFKEGVHWQAVDTTLYEPIQQGIVLLKGATEASKRFYDFMLSPTAQEILGRYGYLLP